MDTVLKHVNNVVYSASLEESQKTYDVWSRSYDEDLDIIGCFPSMQAAKMFEKHSKNCNVALDVGGGTALVVQLARKAGYQKIFDVLDANLSMLFKGEKKNLNIRNIIRHFVQDDGILPLKDESYDVVTTAGAFGPNHIPATAIKGIFNVVKPGGLLIMTIRTNSTGSYKTKYDEVIEELVAAGKIEIIDKQDYMHFEKLENQDVRSAAIVYRRLV